MRPQHWVGVLALLLFYAIPAKAVPVIFFFTGHVKKTAQSLRQHRELILPQNIIALSLEIITGSTGQRRVQLYHLL